MRKHRLARGKVKKKGVMNGLETRHATTVLAGREWRYEAITFKLADRTTYTPDFFFLNDDGYLEIHEVKGGVWLGDSRVKFKMAAELYPMFLWKAYVYKGSKPPKIEEI